MRTYLFYFTLFGLFLFSCNNEQPQDQVKEKSIQDTSFNYFNLDTLKGIYTGEFNKHKISIVINHVSNNHIVGYNILKGKKRNLSGTYLKSNDTVRMVLNEPGDLKSDGKFTIEIYLYDFNAEGKWESFNGNLKRNFKLEKSIQVNENDYRNINEQNISQFINFATDSLGTFELNEDGSCLYSYYIIEDEMNRVEHLKELNGNWNFKKNKLTIDWEKEEQFPGFFNELELIFNDGYPMFRHKERILYSIQF